MNILFLKNATADNVAKSFVMRTEAPVYGSDMLSSILPGQYLTQMSFAGTELQTPVEDAIDFAEITDLNGSIAFEINGKMGKNYFRDEDLEDYGRVDVILQGETQPSGVFVERPLVFSNVPETWHDIKNGTVFRAGLIQSTGVYGVEMMSLSDRIYRRIKPKGNNNGGVVTGFAKVSASKEGDVVGFIEHYDDAYDQLTVVTRQNSSSKEFTCANIDDLPETSSRLYHSNFWLSNSEGNPNNLWLAYEEDGLEKLYVTTIQKLQNGHGNLGRSATTTLDGLHVLAIMELPELVKKKTAGAVLALCSTVAVETKTYVLKVLSYDGNNVVVENDVTLTGDLSTAEVFAVNNTAYEVLPGGMGIIVYSDGETHTVKFDTEFTTATSKRIETGTEIYLFGGLEGFEPTPSTPGVNAPVLVVDATDNNTPGFCYVGSLSPEGEVTKVGFGWQLIVPIDRSGLKGWQGNLVTNATVEEDTSTRATANLKCEMQEMEGVNQPTITGMMFDNRVLGNLRICSDTDNRPTVSVYQLEPRGYLEFAYNSAIASYSNSDDRASLFQLGYYTGYNFNTVTTSAGALDVNITEGKVLGKGVNDSVTDWESVAMSLTYKFNLRVDELQVWAPTTE